jgi:uncharacterized membrane protein
MADVLPFSHMDRTEQTTRCVIIVDEALPAGLAANAAGVLALTLGATAPALKGDDFTDADGDHHPGLIASGLPILRAASQDLTRLRERARAARLEVIDFPTFGQQTNDYDEFRSRIAETRGSELRYLGVAVRGAKPEVRKLTGSLALLR